MARTAARPRLLTGQFALITLVSFFYFFSVGMTLPTLPLFVDRPLAGGEIAVGFAVGSFGVTSLLLRPFTGRLSDRRGRRLIIVAGLVVSTLSTAGLVWTETLAVLFALRLLAGVAEAFQFVGTASAINDIAPDERRAEAVSLFSIALYSGIALGPLAGELILERVGYTEVWIAATASSLVALLLSSAVRETRPTEVAERAGKGPLLSVPAVRPGAGLLVSIWGFAAFNAFIPLYARDIGLSGSRYVFLLLSGIVLVFRSVGATLPDRLGHARTARSSVVAAAAGLILMSVWQSPGGLFLATAIYAIGIALSFPSLMALAVRRSAPNERGAAVGTFTAFLDLGFGVGPVTLGAVAARFGLAEVFLAGGLIAALGLVILAGMRDPPPAPQASAEPCPPL